MSAVKQELQTVMTQNEIVNYAYSRYLNHTPRFLTSDMVNGLAEECGVSVEEAFLSLFCACCGLEPDTTPSHREIERCYLRVGIRRLDPAVYQNDPYYRTVRLPHLKSGRWEMKESFYAPFEPFVCNHPVLTEELREIPQIGYFDAEFRFPAILEGGVEWMTVTPNEIETMREPIEKSHGRVLTLGLGLGYFAFCASEKNDVERVIVVERDGEVISLFRRYILPQFPNRDKIEIVQADAFDFLPKTDPRSFDYMFADLWHDPSDGLDLYLRLRRIEKEKGLQNVDYWIEPSLLSCLRHMVYDKLTDKDAPVQATSVSPYELLSSEFLRRLAPDVKTVK